MSNIYIERDTLEAARQNTEKALARVKAIKDPHTPQWKSAWEEYKRCASDYRAFLIANYNL